jgi:hypothetical protein
MVLIQGVSYVFGRFYEAFLRSLGDLKINSSEKFTRLPLKVDRKIFLWHQAWPHNELLLLKTKVQQAHQYLFMASNTLIMWHRKAMDKEIITALATKFSEKCRKKHKNFCRRGLTHLDATPTFKNCPNTYETPCRSNFIVNCHHL